MPIQSGHPAEIGTCVGRTYRAVSAPMSDSSQAQAIAAAAAAAAAAATTRTSARRATTSSVLDTAASMSAATVTICMLRSAENADLPPCVLCDGAVVDSSCQEARMWPWRRTRAAKLAPEERVQSKMSNTALGVAIGPGVGLSLGLAIGGAEGIPMGLAIGAGIGVAIGASLDEAARRKHD